MLPVATSCVPLKAELQVNGYIHRFIICKGAILPANIYIFVHLVLKITQVGRLQLNCRMDTVGPLSTPSLTIEWTLRDHSDHVH